MSSENKEALVNESSSSTSNAQVPLTLSGEGENIEGNDEAAASTTAQLLSSGILDSCSFELTKIGKEIKELTDQQSVVIDGVTSHNDTVFGGPQFEQIKALMATMKSDLDRLSLVRQEMNSVHERSQKLKMHSVEVEPEPHEVFLGLGLLIAEGRLPGLTPRGYGEGPHCAPFLQINPKGHHCEPADNHLCAREENFRKHVGLLWGNGVPLCVEVLLCSDCQCGREKSRSGQVCPLPDPAYVLLETWTISSMPKRTQAVGGESQCFVNGRSLLQAVRSFLHFSQLSAWLSITKGEEPKNVMYRVTMPGENFASKFVRTPQDHEFPTANFKSHTIKVKVKSLPRSERIPQIYCSNVVCPVRSGKRSPMLSDSLLDPSPLPKRYASPSRESPDHLLFPRQSQIDDRLPSECTSPGKHHCTQGYEDESSPLGCYSKLAKHTRISRRDLFIQSVTNRISTHQNLDGLDPSKQFYANPSRDSSPATTSDEDSESGRRSCRPIPTLHEKIKFRKSLDSAASLVFHGKTKLPLTSSPAPLRKGQDRFDFDSSLISPAQLKNLGRSPFPKSSEASQALLGSFEESVLNGRIEPVSTVEGFTAEIGASGSFCPKHVHLPVTVFFYTFCDNDKVSTPYMAHINVGRKGYAVPRKGTVQVTLFNPLQTVIKMFVVMYDLSDMPADSQTFVRQRILYMPLDGHSEAHSQAQKWLRYLIHLRFASSRSGKIYLHTDLRIVIFRKSDADTATGHSLAPHELRSFTYTPENPKYSPRIPSSITPS